MDPEALAALECGEAKDVRRRRFREAREAGLTHVEARLFADSDTDIGVLRKLVRDGCPPKVIADIVT